MKSISKNINSLNFPPVLVIILFSLAIYANTIGNGFVYDDALTITRNVFIRNLSNLSDLFDREVYFSQSGEMTYRPVATLTYFFDHAVYGLSPWGFHLTNILLHTANGILVYILLIFLIQPSEAGAHKSKFPFSLITNRPLLISLLFIANPVLTEAVNGISFREDLLAFLFYITALILYLKLRSSSISKRRLPAIMVYIFSCLSYSAALFSKEMAVTLPLVVCCYEWLYPRGNSFKSALLNPYNIGYIIITVLYFYFRFSYFSNPVDMITHGWELNERLLTLPLLLSYYIKITVFPVYLSADYDIASIKTLSFSLIISVLAIFSILTGAFLLRKREHGMSFGILFFIITLMPVYNIIPIGNPFAERYLYLPLFGIACAGGLGISRIAFLPGRHLWFNMSTLIILLIFTVLVIQRNSVWKDEYSLWVDTLKKTPNSARAHHGMGNAFAHKGMMEEAIKEYKESTRLAPYYPEAFNALGLAYYKKGMEKEGKEAMAAASDTRGLISYYKKGLVEDAILQYKKALEIDPAHKDARYKLALLYQEQGVVEEAVKEYYELLKYNPDDFEALNGLGLTFFQQGLYEKSLSLYQKALDIDPESIAPYNNIGMVYAVTGRVGEAEKWFKKGLMLDPGSAEAYYNLGFLYQNNGRMAEAVEAYKKALSIKPDYKEVKERLREIESKR